MILEETFSIDAADPAFIHIRHVQTLATGVNLGGPMCFERQNLGWVVAALNASLRVYAFPASVLQRGDDALKVFESGPEQAPITTLMNRRSSHAAHGGIFTLMLSASVARDLVRDLAVLRGP